MFVILELIDEPSSGLVIAVVCFSILVVIGVLLVLKGKQKKSSPYKTPVDKQREEAIREAFSKVKRGNIGIIKLAGIKPNLIMKKGEELVFLMSNISLMEHTATESVSGGGGISIYGFGFSNGVHSEKTEGKEVLDNGKLTLTNNRLVFDGEKRSSETMLTDTLMITPYSDGIGVKSRAREKVQYFVIESPEQCIAQITCGERIYKEPINGEWLAAIIEGAIHSGEYIEEIEGGEGNT